MENDLINAVRQKDFIRLSQLLANGANANTQDTEKSPVLIVAVRYAGTSIVKILLEYGADVNGQDFFGCSALMRAVQRGNNNIIKLLLEYGAFVNTVDKYGWSPLMEAVNRVAPSTVDLLLRYGADINVQDKEGGNAPLLLAFRNGDAASVKLLLEQKSDMNLPEERVLPALSAFCAKERENIIPLLLKKGFLNKGFLREVVPAKCILDLFKNIVESGNVNMLETLLEHYSSLPDSFSSKLKHDVLVQGMYVYGHKSLLMLAAEFNHIPIAEFLLKKHGVLINTQNKYGFSALLYAVAKSHTEMLQFLIENGADINVQDGNGWTALARAVFYCDVEIVDVLLKNGTKINVQNGYSVSADAADWAREEVLSLLNRYSGGWVPKIKIESELFLESSKCLRSCP